MPLQLQLVHPMRTGARCSTRPVAPRCLSTKPPRPALSQMQVRTAPSLSDIRSAPIQISALRFAPLQRIQFPTTVRAYSTSAKKDEEDNENDDDEPLPAGLDPIAVAAQRAARKEHKKSKNQVLKDQRKKMIERSRVQKQKQETRKAKMAPQPGKINQLPKKIRLDEFEEMDD